MKSLSKELAERWDIRFFQNVNVTFLQTIYRLLITAASLISNDVLCLLVIIPIKSGKRFVIVIMTLVGHNVSCSTLVSCIMEAIKWFFVVNGKRAENNKWKINEHTDKMQGNNQT